MVPTLLAALTPLLLAPFTDLEEAQLLASDGGVDAVLGTAISVDGDTLVVGAPGDDELAPNAGAAYVFVRGPGGWTEQAKLTAADGADGDRFGTAVAVHGDTVVVGAPLADIPPGVVDAGAAYAFQRTGTTWTQEAKMQTAFLSASAEFGASIDLDFFTAAIGAPLDDSNDVDSGTVYVFQRLGVTWLEQARLAAPDGVIGDRLGLTVAVSGDTVVAGAVGDDLAGLFAGSCYVFVDDGSGWSHQATLTASDASPGQTFGRDVDVDGDRAVVGADGDTTGGGLAGAMYVFERAGTTWSEDVKLLWDDPDNGDHVGYAVALEGDLIASGSFGDDTGAAFGGALHVFRARARRGPRPRSSSGGPPPTATSWGVPWASRGRPSWAARRSTTASGRSPGPRTSSPCRRRRR